MPVIKQKKMALITMSTVMLEHPGLPPEWYPIDINFSRKTYFPNMFRHARNFPALVLDAVTTHFKNSPNNTERARASTPWKPATLTHLWAGSNRSSWACKSLTSGLSGVNVCVSKLCTRVSKLSNWVRVTISSFSFYGGWERVHFFSLQDDYN